MDANLSLMTSTPSPNSKTFLINKNQSIRPLRIVVSRSHHSYILEDGNSVYDCSGGAGVYNLGSKTKKVKEAMLEVISNNMAYVPSNSFNTKQAERLAETLIKTTQGKMAKVVFYTGGLKLHATFTYK